MHFWIDKRDTYASTGRRVPPSVAARARRERERKAMAAPVHRFTPLGCHARGHRPRQNNGPTIHSTRRQPDEPSLYVEIPPEPPQPTIASLAAARSVTPDTLLRTAALGLHHSPMISPHLKFGMLVSFALASLFLAGAKYYFDKQVVRESWSSGEAAVVLAGVACVCGVWCAARKHSGHAPPHLHTPDRVTSTARREQDIRREPPSLQPPSPPPPSSGAPPPYHIAVLLPCARADDPPEYAALSASARAATVPVPVPVPVPRLCPS